MSTVAPQRRPQPSDDGFSLVEVVVALALLGILATGALGMVVRGVQGSAHLAHAQMATTLGSQALEKVRAVNATAAAGSVTNLVRGRPAAAVTTQWGASTHPDRSVTYQASDAAATATGTPLVPFTDTSTVGGQTYAVSTLIGSCYRLRSATAAAECRRPAPAEPTTDPQYVRLARVMVEVAWTPNGRTSCPGGTCVYRLSSLVDPNVDQTWLEESDVHAVNDSGSVAPGAWTELAVLANDDGVDAGSRPTISVGPSSGAVEVRSGGRIRYTAVAAGTPGSPRTVTFTYSFTTSRGDVSNSALVTVTVGPPRAGAVTLDIPASTAPAPVDLGLLAKAAHIDGDARLTLTGALSGQPAGSAGTLRLDGAAAATGASGQTLTLTPKASSIGVYTFSHSVTSGGSTSSPVTSTVRVVPVGAAYTIRAGSTVLTMDREVPPLSSGWARATFADGSQAMSTNCGSFTISDTGRFAAAAAPPAGASACLVQVVLQGSAPGTESLTTTSTVTVTS